jgi:hypothetical protein
MPVFRAEMCINCSLLARHCAPFWIWEILQRKNVKNFSNLFMMKVIEVFFHGKIECCLVLYDLCILRYKFMLYSVLKLRSKSGAIKMLLLYMYLPSKTATVCQNSMKVCFWAICKVSLLAISNIRVSTDYRLQISYSKL